MGRDAEIEEPRDEVRQLREDAEASDRNTSWLLWWVIGIPAGIVLVGLVVALINLAGSSN